MARESGSEGDVEQSAEVVTAAAHLFAGPGEMRERCRTLDWAATPLGPVEGWPQSLRTAVSICLASGFPKLVMWGPELVQLYNDAFIPILQKRHPAGLGQRARDCWPELWEQVGPMFRGVLETGESIFLEDQLFTPERRGYVEEAYFTFSYSAILDEAYRPAGILTTVIETTRHVQSRGDRERALERMNAELRAAAAERERLLAESEAARADAETAWAARAMSERQFQTLADAIPTLAWTAQPDGHIDWYNARWYEYTGTTPEQMEGWGWQSVHDPAELPWVLDRWRAGIANGQPVEMTFPLRGADGRFRPFLTRIVPHRDADGHVLRWFGTNTDVSLERTAREAAEAANRAKAEFLAVMSHELRTPLNAIGGYAELLEMGIRGPVTAQQREDLSRIQRSQRHLLGLVNEVLNYTKLESGSVHYDMVDVPVSEALAGAEGLVAPQARARGIALGTDGPTDLVVRADPEKLRQLLVNLLSNAVKFTERGGRITVGCATHGAHVLIRVQDTGIGIATDQLDRIFEPFVQVRADLSRPHEGAGLGLAISRDLARGMGGDLTAESVFGTGSTFTLTLRAP